MSFITSEGVRGHRHPYFNLRLTSLEVEAGYYES